jgi:hypothetical protein
MLYARLAGRASLDAPAGEYRCAWLSARDSLDDGWEFTDAARLDLIVRVERARAAACHGERLP